MTTRKITEAEWSKVFHLRCRSKRGEDLSDDHRDLLERAFASDETRYAKMSERVLVATKPFGGR